MFYIDNKYTTAENVKRNDLLMDHGTSFERRLGQY